MTDPTDAMQDRDHLDQTSTLSAISLPDLAEEPEHGLTAMDRSAIDALPEGSALLIVRKGPNLGARFLLDADKTVAGRHPQSEIFLDDVTVSLFSMEYRFCEICIKVFYSFESYC